MPNAPMPASPPIEIPIRDDMIRLGQLVKLAGVVDDGGAARELIERGEVSVGGVVETRRGRQVQVGDEMTVAGERFVVARR